MNRWVSKDKTLYTIFSLRPQGFTGALFEADEMVKGRHFIDLWNHREIDPVVKEGRTFIPVDVEAFEQSYLNTRREGNAGCVALFPELLSAKLKGDTLEFAATVGDKLS